MSEARPLTGARIPKTEALDAPFGTVIQGIVSIDVERVHAELERGLAEADPRTGSALVAAINDVQRRVHLAAKLKAYTRMKYELYKVEHEAWVEERKTAALTTLEQEKKDGKLSKQLTRDMIEAAARLTWPDQFRERDRRLREFQAACHAIEELHEAWRTRARSLSDLKDLVMTLGPQGPYRARSRNEEE